MKNTQTLVGVLENNNKPTFRNSQKSIKAFSLIELSIVLIIMGLLVAGITGGQSLIQSAKIRSFINEANNYKQAINTFYAMNGKLPGDANNDGTMAVKSNDYSLPFREMYEAGILDFDAKECNESEECDGVNLPKSKAFGTGTFYYNNISHDVNADSFPNENFNFLSYDMNYESASTKTFRQIDEKIDDGIPNEGKVLAIGSNLEGSDYLISDYDNETQKIGEMYFKLDL